MFQVNSKSGECWTEFNNTSTCTTSKEFGCFRTILSAEYMTESGIEISTDFDNPIAGDPNSPGKDNCPDFRINIHFSEFHQITRGCLNEKFDSFVETDIQVGCWNDDSETEDIELQIPPEYRLENGNLQQLCRRVIASLASLHNNKSF